MDQRKYISEFGLNMISGTSFLLQQEDLEQIGQTGVDPHIYIIARRPKITLDQNELQITDTKVSGFFKKQIKGKLLPIPFEMPNAYGDSSISLKCEFPHTEYSVEDENGNVLSNGKCALLLALAGPKYWEHLKLEVLYIGQSYGENGSRTASDRLQSHSTLQGIYAEAIKNSPDQDVWLILSTFEPLWLMSFDGRSNNFMTTIKEDSNHIDEVLGTDISEQQQINFTEAALIRYFQPPYNTIYKDSFPNPAHSTYSECYEIDLNMVSVEVHTNSLGVALWSGNVGPNYFHLCSFPLHSKQDRVYMFELGQ